MPIRVIATDIDRTLIDERGMLPPTNIEALQLAVAHGIRVVLATARRRQPTLDILDRLNIKATLVCHNGARMWDENGRELFHQPLDLEFSQQLAKLADERQLPLIFTIDEINFFNPRLSSGTPSTRLDHAPVPSLRQAVIMPPTRIVARGLETIHAIQPLLKDPNIAHIFQYSDNDGEVYSAVIAHPQATKENALSALCQLWSVQPSEVLCIGDAEADAGMLRWAGIGVAPKGSMQVALDAADWIAPSARFGGVAVAIHRYALSALSPGRAL